MLRSILPAICCLTSTAFAQDLSLPKAPPDVSKNDKESGVRLTKLTDHGLTDELQNLILKVNGVNKNTIPIIEPYLNELNNRFKNGKIHWDPTLAEKLRKIALYEVRVKHYQTPGLNDPIVAKFAEKTIKLQGHLLEHCTKHSFDPIAAEIRQCVAGDYVSFTQYKVHPDLFKSVAITYINAAIAPNQIGFFSNNHRFCNWHSSGLVHSEIYFHVKRRVVSETDSLIATKDRWSEEKCSRSLEIYRSILSQLYGVHNSSLDFEPLVEKVKKLLPGESIKKIMNYDLSIDSQIALGEIIALGLIIFKDEKSFYDLNLEWGLNPMDSRMKYPKSTGNYSYPNLNPTSGFFIDLRRTVFSGDISTYLFHNSDIISDPEAPKKVAMHKLQSLVVFSHAASTYSRIAKNSEFDKRLELCGLLYFQLNQGLNSYGEHGATFVCPSSFGSISAAFKLYGNGHIGPAESLELEKYKLKDWEKIFNSKDSPLALSLKNAGSKFVGKEATFLKSAQQDFNNRDWKDFSSRIYIVVKHDSSKINPISIYPEGFSK